MPTEKTFRIRRLWPLAVIGAGFIAFFAFGFDSYVTLDSLRDHRSELIAFVADNALVAGLLFVAVYATATALSVPGALLLSLTSGFLFGTWLGGCLAAIGATIGASAIFLIAKTSLGDAMLARAGTVIKKMEAEFRRDAASYMLILRLVPLFPFWLVNIVPAFLGVPFRTYFVTTAVGILPAAFYLYECRQWSPAGCSRSARIQTWVRSSSLNFYYRYWA